MVIWLLKNNAVLVKLYKPFKLIHVRTNPDFFHMYKL